MLLNGLAAASARVAEIQHTLSELQPAVAASAAAKPQEFAQILSEAQKPEPLPPTKASHSQRASRFDDIIRQAAARYGVDADLVHAVVQAESDYDPDCQSSAGAIGLMQLMPQTARGLGVDPRDPKQNVDAGVRYLRGQLDRFGEVDLALAAYNAGPGAVQRHHGVPPYRETQGYVKRVLQTLWQRKGD